MNEFCIENTTVTFFTQIWLLIQGRAWWRRYSGRSRRSPNISTRFWVCIRTVLRASRASSQISRTSLYARTKSRSRCASAPVHPVRIYQG